MILGAPNLSARRRSPKKSEPARRFLLGSFLQILKTRAHTFADNRHRCARANTLREQPAIVGPVFRFRNEIGDSAGAFEMIPDTLRARVRGNAMGES